MEGGHRETAAAEGGVSRETEEEESVTARERETVQYSAVYCRAVQCNAVQ